MQLTKPFKEIDTSEEFFAVFQGLCNIAEKSFNQFEEQVEDIDKNNKAIVLQYCKGLSYLMSITFVIIGMRGQYPSFRGEIGSFYLEKEGTVYDQQYLYKMNDYFTERFNKILSALENIDPELSQPYRKIWSEYY